MINNNYKQSNNNDIKSPRTEGEFTDVMLRDSAKFQEKYGFEIGSNGSVWNNESDAFRHAYMQAYLTLRYSDFVAEQLGNYHERDGNKNNNQDKAEETMDQHNNKIGREIGNEIRREQGGSKPDPDQDEIKEIIARKVAERMQSGKLILDPTGRRTPKNKLNIQKDSKSQKLSSSQKGCVGSYQVSGYKRADGTEVKGYTRTCGAKHSGMSKGEQFAGQNKYKDKKFQDFAEQSELEDAIFYFI